MDLLKLRARLPDFSRSEIANGSVSILVQSGSDFNYYWCPLKLSTSATSTHSYNTINQEISKKRKKSVDAVRLCIRYKMFKLHLT